MRSIGAMCCAISNKCMVWLVTEFTITRFAIFALNAISPPPRNCLHHAWLSHIKHIQVSQQTQTDTRRKSEIKRKRETNGCLMIQGL